MSISTRIAEMQTAVNNFATNALAKIKSKPATVVTADDASTFGGTRATQYIGAAQNAVTTHAADVNNPHGTVVADVGGLTTAQIDAVISSILPLGIVPISQYGPPDADTVAATFSGLTVTFPANTGCVMAGNYFPLQQVSKLLSDISASPLNKTFYAHVILNVDKVVYQLSEIPLAETTTVMFIGTVTTGAAGITAVNITTVTRLDTYRLSGLPVGSAIATTAGNANTPVKINAGWKP